MSFCPKCGREIIDETLGCPICGVKENTRPETTQADDQPAEKVDSFTVEDAKGTYQKFESTEGTSGGTWANGGTNTEYKPVNEQGIHPALKVIVIVLIIMVGGIGAVAGLIAGIVLMKSPVEDNQKFGKLITIISAVMLGLSLICCVVSGLTGLLALPFADITYSTYY
ncbi:hypothetical protein [Anaerotignum sp.]|uniref:hypothetical protein n=1 Tax=Anaerotignum sp. TaxID=2039241 RepID=UPI002A90BCED|nr:hypothetical protein [Anaerotignum sp.]MCI7657288.1 hypothetical protein [Clostridia bacterium]MDY5415512.1 hypothetical protein [Anaerotignum sp.]